MPLEEYPLMPTTNRTTLLNSYLYKTKHPNYLEIGVRNGENYFAMDAHRKFGVDPEYFFAKRAIIRSLFKKSNWTQRMFRCTSDEFFKFHARRIFKKRKLDLVFIDGMHTYEQSLQDGINSLKFLNPEGIIVFHDCNPWSKESARPLVPFGKVSWNGDVWKTIYHYRQYPEHFECFTYDADEGLGILKRKKGGPNRKIPKIVPLSSYKDMTFDDLDSHREEYLGLRELNL